MTAARIAEIFGSQSKSVQTPFITTVLNSMLYRGFGEFEREFGQFFEQKSMKGCDEEGLRLRELQEVKNRCSFNELCMRIKREYCSRKSVKETSKCG